MTASPTLFGRSLLGSRVYGFAPPSGGSSPNYPTQHAILFHTTTVTLAWRNPPLANLFEVQVSLLPDFSVISYDDASLTVNTKIFTDGLTNSVRRFWRWRWSSNSGTNWSRWSHVGSYWVDTGAAQDISIPRNTWCLINPSPVTDYFVFEIFPMYKVNPQNIYRVRDRNRLGTLLSEFVTTKGFVDMNFDDQRWLESGEVEELRRYAQAVRTFYLGMFHDYKLGDPVPNIWSVQFVGDPDVALFTAGRQDMLTGTLSFQEV